MAKKLSPAAAMARGDTIPSKVLTGLRKADKALLAKLKSKKTVE